MLNKSNMKIRRNIKQGSGLTTFRTHKNKNT